MTTTEQPTRRPPLTGFLLRLDPSEKDIVVKLSKLWGLSQAATIRQMIRFVGVMHAPNSPFIAEGMKFSKENESE